MEAVWSGRTPCLGRAKSDGGCEASNVLSAVDFPSTAGLPLVMYGFGHLFGCCGYRSVFPLPLVHNRGRVSSPGPDCFYPGIRRRLSGVVLFCRGFSWTLVWVGLCKGLCLRRG